MGHHKEDELPIFLNNSKVYLIDYNTFDITPGIYCSNKISNGYTHYVYDINNKNRVLKHTECLHHEKPFNKYVFRTMDAAYDALIKEQENIINTCKENIRLIENKQQDYNSKIKPNLNIDLDLMKYFIIKDKDYIKEIDDIIQQLDLLEEEYTNITFNIVNGEFKCYDDFKKMFKWRINRKGNRFFGKYNFKSRDTQMLYNIKFMIDSIVYELEHE